MKAKSPLSKLIVQLVLLAGSFIFLFPLFYLIG